MKTYIPKDDQRLPDNYTIKVFYVTGKVEELNLVFHKLIDTTLINLPDNKIRVEVNPCPFLEYCTVDDVWGNIPMGSVQRLEWDKNFSKMVAIKQEAKKE